MPQELDCGHCLAGDTKTVLMKCDNFGGEGSFKLLPVDNTPQETNQVSVYQHVKYVPLLHVRPVQVDLLVHKYI